MAAQIGLTPGSAARDNERNRNDQRRIFGEASLMHRTGDGDGIVPARDRAEAMHRTVSAATMRVHEEPSDGLTGALPRYMR